MQPENCGNECDS